MNASFIVALAAATPLVGVSVDTATATATAACVALDAVATSLALSPRHWVERAPTTLDVIVAVDGPHLVARRSDGELAVEAPLAPDPLVAAGQVLDEALDWRPPSPLDLRAWLAPSDAAWAAACAPLSSAASARASAIGAPTQLGDGAPLFSAATAPYLERATRPRPPGAPPPPTPGRGERGLIADLVRAHLGGSGAERVRAWQRLEASLEARLSFPLWATSGSPPGARFAAGSDDALHVFADGRFTALATTSGRVAWTLDAGRAEPRSWSSGRLRLLISEAGLLALASDGRVAWRAFEGDPDLFPELAITERLVCAASPGRLACIRPGSGREAWSLDLVDPAVGGPASVDDRLVLPTARHVEVRALGDGRLVGRTPLRDGWSAPPLPTPSGRVWVFTGSDAVHVFDPDRGAFIRHFDGLPELHWPPVVAHGDLFFEAREARRTQLWRLDPRSGPEPWARDAAAPILPLPDYLGVLVTRPRAVEGRTAAQSTRFRTRLSGTPERGDSGPDFVALADDRRVWIVDGRSGELAWTFELEGPQDPITDLDWLPRGGGIVTEAGIVSGLAAPSDPRLSLLSAWVRRRHSEALMEAGRRRTACSRLTVGPNSHPREVQLALQCPEPLESEARAWIEARAPAGSSLRERLEGAQAP